MRVDWPRVRRYGAGVLDTVTVDALNDVTTGISAADRARTISLLADPLTPPEALSRPGHVVPTRVDVSRRNAGVAAAALTLCDQAGQGQAAVMRS